MRVKKQVQAEEGPKVPGYIVTFSDMVTLLLTFFVMLLSLATVQDPELFHSGRDSFVRSIRGMGLGLLFGQDQSVDFGYMKQKYTIEGPDDFSKSRTIDATEEKIRRVFNKLRRSMKTMPSQITGQRADLPSINIRFASDGTALNESARKSLAKFCTTLQQYDNSETLKLYVLGLTNEKTTEREKWILSAKRSKAVADYIRQISPSPERWSVYSWGAGPGGQWTVQGSSVPEGSQITIAVLREPD